jgi:hypothetical protein
MDDWFAEWYRIVFCHHFFGSCIDGLFPIKELVRQRGIVRSGAKDG